MKTLTQISRAALTAVVLAAAGNAMAANQPFNAISASVAIDKAVVTANAASIVTVGLDSYNSSTGVLTAPVASVVTSVEGGPALINLGDTDGFKVVTLLGTVTFGDFTFDYGTGSLIGDIKGLGINYQDGAILVANTLEGNLGSDLLSSVLTSSSGRPLYLAASNFGLAPAFSAYLDDAGFDPTKLTAVSGIIKGINIGTKPIVTPTIPEPSTYALMGLGLVGIAALARRKRAA